MKIYTYLILTFCYLITTNVCQGQNDFSISLNHYPNGSMITNDTIKTNFTIKNNGPQTFNAGDTIYVSAKLNGMYFGTNLIGDKTPVVLTSNLNVNDTLQLGSGFILASQTLFFFPGDTTLNVCYVVWGKGIASVDMITPSFPLDKNASNNISCVTYNPNATIDLAVHYNNYTNGEISSQDTIQTEFRIINYGPLNLTTGDTIYISSKFNNTFFGLDLLGNKTAHVLSSDLVMGDSITINPGYVLGSQTAPFVGGTPMSVCIYVWGKGIASVNFAPSFPGDLDSTNNTTCMIYDPTSASIEDIISSLNVNLYPNPANNAIRVTIDSNQQFVFSVFDVTGKEVLVSKKNIGTTNVSLTELNSGMFLYKIQLENGGFKVGKFIKN
jgi:hypothetical protein